MELCDLAKKNFASPRIKPIISTKRQKKETQRPLG